MILEISESKGAEFSWYEFYFKKNIHRTFLYLSKCPLNTFTVDCENFVVIKGIYRYQFKCNYLKNRNILLHCYCVFGI